MTRLPLPASSQYPGGRPAVQSSLRRDQSLDIENAAEAHARNVPSILMLSTTGYWNSNASLVLWPIVSATSWSIACKYPSTGISSPTDTTPNMNFTDVVLGRGTSVVEALDAIAAEATSSRAVTSLSKVFDGRVADSVSGARASTARV